jgi:hypothetical protein
MDPLLVFLHARLSNHLLVLVLQWAVGSGMNANFIAEEDPKEALIKTYPGTQSVEEA